jgi:hypothetical protein
MSYQSIAQLTGDPDFNGRSQSAAAEQANTFKDDPRADCAALSRAVLRGETDKMAAFTRAAAAGPGIGDKVDTGDGTIDQTLVTDSDLLSLTQTNFPVVASLYYRFDGTPV